MKTLAILLLSAVLITSSTSEGAETATKDDIARLSACGMFANLAGDQDAVDRYRRLLQPYIDSSYADIAYNMGKAEGVVLGTALTTGSPVQPVAADYYAKLCANEEM